MNCSEVGNMADDYVFGLLEPPMQEKLTAHVDSCRACAKAIEEARSRRRIFSAWSEKPRAGAADRLLARTRSGNLGGQPAYGRQLVRIMAAAAVILAAVILPRLFILDVPSVGGYEPQITCVEGTLRDSARREFVVPGDYAKNAYLVVRLKSADSVSLVEAAIRLNDSDKGRILTGAAASEEMYVLTREQGLKEGRNSVTIENLGTGSLEFEVTLVTGKIR